MLCELSKVRSAQSGHTDANETSVPDSHHLYWARFLIILFFSLKRLAYIDSSSLFLSLKRDLRIDNLDTPSLNDEATNFVSSAFLGSIVALGSYHLDQVTRYLYVWVIGLYHLIES